MNMIESRVPVPQLTRQRTDLSHKTHDSGRSVSIVSELSLRLVPMRPRAQNSDSGSGDSSSEENNDSVVDSDGYSLASSYDPEVAHTHTPKQTKPTMTLREPSA